MIIHTINSINLIIIDMSDKKTPKKIGAFRSEELAVAPQVTLITLAFYQHLIPKNSYR